MAGRVTRSWHKSTRCGESSHCVEVASFGQQVGLRDSTRPHETLTLTLAAFRDLVERIKRGELDR